MALQANSYEFDDDHITETDRLHSHNRALRDNIQAVAAIKYAMALDEYEEAYEMWMLLPEEIRTDLWISPSKGGIFTTQERKIMLTNRFSKGEQECQKV